jgi:hypothetical protein
MTIYHLLVVLLLLTSVASLSKDEFPEYSANCTFHLNNSNNVTTLHQEICHTALFSNWDFSFTAEFLVLETELCAPQKINFDIISTTTSTNNVILGVKRGGCSFEDKAKNAQLAGASGLVIFNSGPSFPVGASNDVFVSKIPVVMIQTSERYETAGHIGQIHMQFSEFS